MNSMILDLATLSGLCLGITQVLKMAFNVPDRMAPLVSLILGISAALLFISVTRDSALLGLFGGLSASGLYSGGKTMAGQ